MPDAWAAVDEDGHVVFAHVDRLVTERKARSGTKRRIVPLCIEEGSS